MRGRKMGKRGWRALSALVVTLAVALAAAAPGFADTPAPSGSTAGEDTATLAPGTVVPEQNDELESQLLLRDQAFISGRLAGSAPLSVDQAGALRKAAADQARVLKNPPPAGPTTFSGNWSPLGPNPIVQVQRSDSAFAAQSGRIGALAIRKDGTFILGAAQGGIWLWNPTSKTWSPRTDNLPSTAIGALAVAPKDDNIVYAGTGEGALSGDSYFGNGILRSSDGGASWNPIMSGLPADADFAAGLTRFNIAISHPAGQGAVLYTGFDWVDTSHHHHAGRLFKSTDEASWVEAGHGTGIDSVVDY